MKYHNNLHLLRKAVHRAAEQIQQSAIDTTFDLASHLASSPAKPRSSSTSQTTQEHPIRNWTVTIIFILLAIIVIVLIITWLVRRYRTYERYNRNPESFLYKPNFNIMESRNKNSKTFKVLEDPNNPEPPLTKVVTRKLPQGNCEEVTFQSTKGKWAIVYFDRQLYVDSYFEVELAGGYGDFVMGYLHSKDVDHLKGKKPRQFTEYGILMSKNGFVKKSGLLVYNYKLSSDYGDSLGIGITRKDSRGWFTYNGALLNNLTTTQKHKWEQENMDKQDEKKKGTPSLMDNVMAGKPEEDQEEAKRKIETEKVDQELSKRKVVADERDGTYYAFIACKCEEPTTLLVNCGCQRFRFVSKELEKGLYYDPYIEKCCGCFAH